MTHTRFKQKRISWYRIPKVSDTVLLFLALAFTLPSPPAFALKVQATRESSGLEELDASFPGLGERQESVADQIRREVARDFGDPSRLRDVTITYDQMRSRKDRGEEVQKIEPRQLLVRGPGGKVYLHIHPQLPYSWEHSWLDNGTLISVKPEGDQILFGDILAEPSPGSPVRHAHFVPLAGLVPDASIDLLRERLRNPKEWIRRVRGEPSLKFDPDELWEAIAQGHCDFVLGASVTEGEEGLFVMAIRSKWDGNGLYTDYGSGITFERLDKFDQMPDLRKLSVSIGKKKAVSAPGLEVPGTRRTGPGAGLEEGEGESVGDSLRRQGHELRRHRDFTGALAKYAAALAAHPEDVKALTARASVLSELGRYEEALPLIDRALKLDLKSLQVRIVYAKVLIGLGRAEEALVVIQETILLKPSNIPTYVVWAKALNALHRYREALKVTQKATALNRYHVSVLGASAVAWNGLREFSKVLELTDRMLVLDSANHQARLLRANALNGLGRCEETLALIQGIPNLNPVQNRRWYRVYAQALRGLNRYPEALSAVQRGAAQDPNGAQAYWEHARDLYDRGQHSDYVAVEKTLDRGLAVFRDDVRLMRSLVRVLRRLDRHTDADDTEGRLKEIKARSALAHEDFGRVFLGDSQESPPASPGTGSGAGLEEGDGQEGDFEDEPDELVAGIEKIRRSVRQKKQTSHTISTNSLAKRAKSHMEAGRYDAAEKDWDALIGINRSDDSWNAWVYVQRAKTRLAFGKYALAEGDASDAIRLDLTKSYSAYFVRAQARLYMGKLKEAKSDALEVLGLSGHGPYDRGVSQLLATIEAQIKETDLKTNRGTSGTGQPTGLSATKRGGSTENFGGEESGLEEGSQRLDVHQVLQGLAEAFRKQAKLPQGKEIQDAIAALQVKLAGLPEGERTFVKEWISFERTKLSKFSFGLRWVKERVPYLFGTQNGLRELDQEVGVAREAFRKALPLPGTEILVVGKTPPATSDPAVLEEALALIREADPERYAQLLQHTRVIYLGIPYGLGVAEPFNWTGLDWPYPRDRLDLAGTLVEEGDHHCFWFDYVKRDLVKELGFRIEKVEAWSISGGVGDPYGCLQEARGHMANVAFQLGRMESSKDAISWRDKSRALFRELSRVSNGLIQVSLVEEFVLTQQGWDLVNRLRREIVDLFVRMDALFDTGLEEGRERARRPIHRRDRKKVRVREAWPGLPMHPSWIIPVSEAILSYSSDVGSYYVADLVPNVKPAWDILLEMKGGHRTEAELDDIRARLGQKLQITLEELLRRRQKIDSWNGSQQVVPVLAAHLGRALAVLEQSVAPPAAQPPLATSTGLEEQPQEMPLKDFMRILHREFPQLKQDVLLWELNWGILPNVDSSLQVVMKPEARYYRALAFLLMAREEGLLEELQALFKEGVLFRGLLPGSFTETFYDIVKRGYTKSRREEIAAKAMEIQEELGLDLARHDIRWQWWPISITGSTNTGQHVIHPDMGSTLLVTADEMEKALYAIIPHELGENLVHRQGIPIVPAELAGSHYRAYRRLEIQIDAIGMQLVKNKDAKVRADAFLLGKALDYLEEALEGDSLAQEGVREKTLWDLASIQAMAQIESELEVSEEAQFAMREIVLRIQGGERQSGLLRRVIPEEDATAHQRYEEEVTEFTRLYHKIKVRRIEQRDPLAQRSGFWIPGQTSGLEEGLSPEEAKEWYQLNGQGRKVTLVDFYDVSDQIDGSGDEVIAFLDSIESDVRVRWDRRPDGGFFLTLVSPQQVQQVVQAVPQVLPDTEGMGKTAGLEELSEKQRALKEMLDPVVKEVAQISLADKPIAFLIESGLTDATSSELVAIEEHLQQILKETVHSSHRVIFIDPLNEEDLDDYQRSYKHVVILRRSRSQKEDRSENTIYLLFPSGSTLVPKKILPSVILDALAEWQQAKGWPVRSNVPYLRLSDLSAEEAWQAIRAAFSA